MNNPSSALRHFGDETDRGLGRALKGFQGRGRRVKNKAGGGEEEEKIRLQAAIVRLANPYTEQTGALIGAVGSLLIATFSGKCERPSRFLIWSHLRCRLDF